MNESLPTVTQTNTGLIINSSDITLNRGDSYDLNPLLYGNIDNNLFSYGDVTVSNVDYKILKNATFLFYSIFSFRTNNFLADYYCPIKIKNGIIYTSKYINDYAKVEKTGNYSVYGAASSHLVERGAYALLTIWDFKNPSATVKYNTANRTNIYDFFASWNIKLTVNL